MTARHIGHDAFYDLPVFEHESAAAFDPAVTELAVHRVPWTGGHLLVAGRLRGEGPLHVGFHGAVDRTQHRLPLFERLTSRTAGREPFLIFADPTLDLSADLSIGWYLGSENNDPSGAILQVITRAHRVLGGSEAPVFAGSSAGGFAALMLSAAYPGSLAVAFAPQTAVWKYYARFWKALRGHAFTGTPDAALRGRLGSRLSVVERYRTPPQNYVYYVQNQDDPHHVEAHCAPFASLWDLEPMGGLASSMRVRIVPEWLGAGHVSPPVDLYEGHLAVAKAWRRTAGRVQRASRRPGQSAQPSSDGSASTSVRVE